MGSFFIGGGGGSGGSVDWNDITNKPNVDIAGLDLDFTFSDVFPKLIGLVTNNLHISEIEIIFDTPFNSGITFTIGDSINNARLMSALDNEPQVVAKYAVDADYKYGSSTNVYLYISGVPTQGSGTVHLYYD